MVLPFFTLSLVVSVVAGRGVSAMGTSVGAALRNITLSSAKVFVEGVKSLLGPT